MADPIITNGVRALMVWQGSTGLPEDRYINSWAFTTPAEPTDVELGLVKDRLLDFYGAVWSPSTTPISAALAGDAITESLSEFRVYRLADAPPRPPSIFPWDGPALTSGNTYPTEVALCLSFYSERNLAGSRGRVYLGPFLESVGQTGGDGLCRPSDNLMQRIKNAAVGLATFGDGITWSILTGTGMKPVTGGWVDNAFDTQRRRGQAPSSRVTWVSP